MNLSILNKLQFKKILVKYIFPFCIFASVLVLVFYKLIFNPGVVNYNDTVYYWNINVNNLVSTWHYSYLGHDFSQSIFLRIPTVIINYFFAYFLDSNQLISLLTFLAPINLVLFISYLIFFRITSQYLLSILLPLLFIFNNYTLEGFYTGAGAFLFYGYLSCLLSFYFCYRIWEKKSINNLDIFKLAFASLVAFHPFYFVINLLLVFIFVVYLFVRKKCTIFFPFKKYLLYLIFSVFLNAYWIFPFISATLTLSNDLKHGSDNNINNYNAAASISTIINAVAFINSKKLISKEIYYSYPQYTFYCFFIVLILFILIKVKKNREILLFAGFSLIIYFDLSLGPNGLFFGKIFNYLWNNFSFFSFFRSFKRFFVVIPVLYVLFVGFWLKTRSNGKVVISFLLCIAALVHYPLLTGNLSNLIPSFRVPSEYHKFNSKIKEEKSKFNIIVFPSNSYERYSWSSTKNNIEPMNYYWLMYYLEKPPVFISTAHYLIHNSPILYDIEKSISLNRNIKNSLKNMGIKYIFIGKDMVNYKWEEVDYKIYDEYFKNNGFDLIESNDLFNIYENKIYSEIVTSEQNKNISFYSTRPTKYKIKINRLMNYNEINFLQNYSANWYLYLNKINNKNNHNKKIFNPMDLSYIIKKPVFNETHKILNEYANGWTIKPEFIKQNYSKEYYVENPDGSLDIELVLYFKPQLYFYLGIFFSVVTLFVFLGYLNFNQIKKKI